MKLKKILLITAITLLFNLISVSGLLINDVVMNPKVVAPGETSKIILSLDNNGEEDLENVNVLLDLKNVPFAPINSASEYNFDEIKEDRVEKAEFEIITQGDAQTGIYKIPVQISYFIEGETEEINKKTSLISIKVNSQPVIGIGVEEGVFIKNQENEINLRTTNKGLGDLKFVEIEIEESIYYNLLSQKQVYIGDLDSDDFESADFKIFFKSNSLNKINLPITIRYKDSLNNEYAEESEIEINVYSIKKAQELGLKEKNNIPTYVAIAIILIIIYLIYRRIKKYLKNKKNNKS